MKRTLNSCFLLVIALSLSLIPQTLFAEFAKFRIKLSVSADESIRGEIVSYVSRELRSLGDVIISDDDPYLVWLVVATEIRSKAGEKTGIVFSSVVLLPYPMEELYSHLELYECPKSAINWTKKIFTSFDLLDIEGHWVIVGSPKNIKGLCQSLAADFDHDHLESRRKTRQIISDELKKYKQEKKQP